MPAWETITDGNNYSQVIFCVNNAQMTLILLFIQIHVTFCINKAFFNDFKFSAKLKSILCLFGLSYSSVTIDSKILRNWFKISSFRSYDPVGYGFLAVPEWGRKRSQYWAPNLILVNFRAPENSKRFMELSSARLPTLKMW